MSTFIALGMLFRRTFLTWRSVMFMARKRMSLRRRSVASSTDSSVLMHGVLTVLGVERESSFPSQRQVLHHYSIHPRHMHTQTGRAVQMTVPRVVTRGWEGGFIAACPGRAVQMPGFRIITRDWEKGFTAACPGRAVQKPSQVVT